MQSAALTLLSTGLLACAVAACSSESLGSDAGEGDGDAGAASGSGGATGGGDGGGAPATGGKSSPPSDLPDYTESPCYGQAATTLVYDGETHETPEVAVVCRGETERVRLYVAPELFDSTVTQAMVNGFLHRYDLIGNPGSYREDLGVLRTDEAVFGALPTAALPDGKLPIFVIDTNGGGAGYLCSWCGGVELHLDGTDLTPLDGDGAVSIAAHETFHAIHRAYDANEVGWLDETLAQAAMVANGFFDTDRALLNQFARKPNVNWGPGLSDTRTFDYGAGLAFGAYLWELGGPELMQAITQNPANAWVGLDAALEATGHDQSGVDALLDMAVALWLDDPERGYGFESFDLVDGVRSTALDADVNGVVEPYALAYFAIGEGVTALRVEGADTLRARIATDADPVQLVEVEIGVDTPVPAGGGRVLILTAASTTRVGFDVVLR
jgi:hypothetical protein